MGSVESEATPTPAPDRSRWILLLLLQGEGRQRYNKPVVGRTRLIKELFLLKMTYGVRDMEYSFIPYWYGPFCPEIYADLQALQEIGEVGSAASPGGEVLSLTLEGVRRAQALEANVAPETLRRIRDCKEKYNPIPFEDLVAYVYERWPKFTTRSLRSPATVLEEFRKQAKKAGITAADVDQAIAEYRTQVPSA